MSPIHQPGPLNLPARPIRSTMAGARHSLTAGVVLLLLGLAVSDIDKIARQLAGAGQITVWQYAVRKAGDGALQQAPIHRVAVFRQDTLRIEPYVAAVPVIPPSGP
jgi:hypothetical protein